MKSYILKVCISIIFLINFNNFLSAEPVITYIQDKISPESKEIILNFHNKVIKILTEITGVNPDFSFEFYCDKFSYLSWSHQREFWNSGNCSDEWFKSYFYGAYVHELAQLYFVKKFPHTNDIEGDYKNYFAPRHVIRIDEHLSFAIARIFWKEYAPKINLKPNFIQTLGYELALNSEYFKVLLDISPATVHHLEVNYQNFISFSFKTGEMLYLKLYLYDKNFIKNFINHNVNLFKTPLPLNDIVSLIINTYKKDGFSMVDDMKVEDFVWKHPDFRRFIEDYKKKYYFDIITVDYKKFKTFPWFFFNGLTKINPSNFCFIVTNFKNYPKMEEFNNDTYKINYKILDEDGKIIKTGTSINLISEHDKCENIIPENLKDGIYKIEASVKIDNKTLNDEMEFVIKNKDNFYVNELNDYKYLVMRDIQVGDKCYFLKMSLYDNLLKLDELNEVNCNISSKNKNIEILSDGKIFLKNIFYKNKCFNLKIFHSKDFFYQIETITLCD